MEKLYFNGDIITMEGEGDTVEAVLVADGIIKATGNYDDVAAQKSADCEMVDLQGKTLMPGLIDPHSHIAGMAPMFADLCDLSKCENMEQIVDAMKAYLAERQIPAGQPVVGVNYDDNFLAEQRHPDRKLLDTISTEHPVILLHISVHMVVGNTMALQVCNYTNEKEFPGGEVGRYEDGTMNGYLAETASYDMIGYVMFGMQSQMAKVWGAAQKLYLSHGVTTAQEGSSSLDLVKMLMGFDKAGMLKLDVVNYISISDYADCGESMAAVPTTHRKYDGHVKVGGYKLILDGSPQARTAWVSQPYEGTSECGVPILSDEKAEAAVKRAMDDDVQLLAHCNGDAASEQYLRAVEKMLPLSENPNKENLRFTMIHCQTVRKDQIERMAKLKMIPSIYVGHVNYWGDVHMKNFGPVRGSRISPVKDALDAGLVYNLHTDCPVMPPDMLMMAWCAVNRVSRNGNLIGPEQRVSVYDALKGITINAAYAYFEEDSKGSIKAGKRADLVILSDSPMKVDPMAIRDIKVLETIKDGETVYTA